MAKQFEQAYQVPFYQVDLHQRMRLSALLGLALQVSGLQAESLGVDDQTIFERHGLVWVVTDYHLAIQRLPRYREKIVVKTQPTSYTKFTCYRDFQILSQSGQELVTIQATFVLLDYQTRRPHSVLADLIGPYQSDKLDRRPAGYSFPSLDLDLAQKSSLTASYSDLDLNGHVNNGSYLDWFYNSLPLDFLAQHVPCQLHLSYRKEVQAGTLLDTYYHLDHGLSHHQLVSQQGLHAQAIIEWRKDEL